jgi:ribosome biogenesis protein YTM1
VNGTSTRHQLNTLINTLLDKVQDEEDEDISKTREFDFLIEGQLLRLPTLEEQLEHKSVARGEFLSGEKEVVVEYLLKEKAPTPDNNLLHDDWVSCVDANLKYIVTGSYDGSLHIWTLSGDHQIAIPGHGAPVKAVQWVDGNRLPENPKIPTMAANEYWFISSSHDETVIVWKWTSTRNDVDCLYVCRGHCRSVDCLSINGDLFASGSFDTMVKIWSLESDVQDKAGGDGSEAGTSKKPNKRLKENVETKSKVPLITLSGHSEAVTGINWLSSGDSSAVAPEVATCSMDNTLRVWDIEVNETKRTLVGSKAFLSLAYSGLTNTILTGSCDRHIRLWDPRSSEGTLVKATFSSHQAWVSSVAWSPVSEYHFMSGSFDNLVKEWDLRSTKAPLYDLMGHQDKVLCVNWSNSEYLMSGAADNQLKLFAHN